MNSANFLDIVWRDLRYALRNMRQNPAFVATAVITLALGIGANTAMFSVIGAVLLKPLEFRQPDRLVYRSVENAPRNGHDNQFGRSQFEELRAQARSFESFGAYGVNPETVSVSGEGGAPEALRAARVSANFLDVLGIRPIAGRSFVAEEDRRGGPDVALISADLWERRFGGDPHIAGRTVTLDSKACTIVGVLPPGFEFPFAAMDVWVQRRRFGNGVRSRDREDARAIYCAAESVRSDFAPFLFTETLVGAINHFCALQRVRQLMDLCLPPASTMKRRLGSCPILRGKQEGKHPKETRAACEETLANLNRYRAEHGC